MKKDRVAVLRDLANAAHPYGLRVERTAHSTLPELVFLRPSNGTELGRLRFFEPEGGDPFMRTVILNEVSQAEQVELETHLSVGLLPLVTRAFSYSLWMGLADWMGVISLLSSACVRSGVPEIRRPFVGPNAKVRLPPE